MHWEFWDPTEKLSDSSTKQINPSDQKTGYKGDQKMKGKI